MRKADYAKRRWRRCPLCGSKIRRSRATRDWNPGSRWCDRCVLAKKAARLLEQYDEPKDDGWTFTGFDVSTAEGSDLDRIAKGVGVVRHRGYFSGAPNETDLHLRARLRNRIHKP